MVIQSLFLVRANIPIYIFSSFSLSMGKMLVWYTTFSELHFSPMGHSSLILQLQSDICAPLSFKFDLSTIFRSWLYIIFEIYVSNFYGISIENFA